MKIILFAISLLVSVAGLSQKIDNNLVFEKGKKLEMRITINSSMPSMGNTVDAVIERVFDIEDMVDGKAVIEHKVKRIQFKMQSMMGSEDFDSEREEDMQGQLGKALEKTLKSKYTMTLDSTGIIVDVKKDDDNNAENKSASQDVMGNIIAQLGEGLKEPVAGDKSDFVILPSMEISKGDSWTDTLANGTGNYSIVDITDSTIVISLKEETKTEKKQEVMGNEVSISTTEKTTGTITIDRNTKILKEKNVVTEATGSVSAAGQTFPINSTTTKKWKVK